MTGSQSRRKFLHTTSVAGGTLAACGWLATGQAVGGRLTETAASETAGSDLEPGAVILFQGDSITDAGRSRNAKQANQRAGLGNGYPLLLAAALLADHPKLKLQIFNRGISGNKVPDLDKRWQEDALSLKPNVLSILIGVNDIWHKLNGRYSGTVADYERGYRDLIQRTREALPETRIIICEPFVLRCGAVNDKWFPEFDQRRQAARKVADAFKLSWVPFQTMFDKAVGNVEPSYWAGDGVHPSMAGHALMAKQWRAVVGL